MPQEFKPLSVGNNVTVILCVEPVKKIVWIFVMIFSKCLLNRYFIFSLNPPGKSFIEWGRDTARGVI